MSASGRTFDLAVLGAGPAGETVASRLAARGLKTALIERELLGGECAYWACIPSKTLLRPGEVRSEAERAAGSSRPSLDFGEIASYRDFMVRDHDDSGQAKEYAEQGVSVFRGEGRLTGPGRLEVGDEQLVARRVVIATGSEPVIPEIPGLGSAGYWTNREVTGMREVPSSACVLGGGPVGVELAQLLRRLGAEVHLIEQQPRLMAGEDERVSELLAEALRADGIHLALGAEVRSVEAGEGRRIIHHGEQTVRCDELVVATSRRPRVDGLGLESVGIERDPEHGGIAVDERCRAADSVWAVGDVTGVMPFSHVAMYQGRIVVADIGGQGGRVRADYAAVPRTVFCDPEVAAVGVTAQQAPGAARARITLKDQISRPWTYETDARGELEVIADRERGVLIGAWAVAPLASEWIHYAALAIKAQIPIAVLADTVAQFPTYTEAFLKAIDQLEL
jgi:pyruvate/2-oxoglutarate dehydrogenase complex dihydrolipoamide dehydrogenase (E3) component